MPTYEKVDYADRLNWLRKWVKVTQPCLEIGPSHNPVAPRLLGFNSTIIDALDAESLRAKYRELDVDIKAIEAVDHVWRGESLIELTGRQQYFHTIVASHVIEHLPNPLAFLRDCETMLCDGGRLILAVPDHRRCFDFLRSLSTTGEVLQAYQEKWVVHPPSRVYDFHAAYMTAKGLPTWFETALVDSDIALTNTLEGPYQQFQEACKTPSEYLDVHGWVYSPASFLLIAKELQMLGLVHLHLEVFAVSSAHEFYAVFTKSEASPNLLDSLDRKELYWSIYQKA